LGQNGLPHLNRHVRAMVDLQLRTAAGPGEIVTMRTDRRGKISMKHTPTIDAPAHQMC